MNGHYTTRPRLLVVQATAGALLDATVRYFRDAFAILVAAFGGTR